MNGRTGELHARLHEVRARIDAACRACGRRPDEVDLLVVTKTFPPSDVALLAGLGVVDIGESRDQEARRKHDELGPTSRALRWHMIGQVQRNKARSVAHWADVVESVDRFALAEALSRAAVEAGRRIDVLVQVNLDPDPEPGRGGCPPADVLALVGEIEPLPGLQVAGLMAVAPHPGDPDEAFARLAGIRERVLGIAPAARVLSAGMSDDLEAAVRHGATQVRIGSAILGSRPPLR